MTVFVPVKLMAMAILMSVIFLLPKTGFCIKQAGICRPFCTGSDCITVNRDRVDFETAEEACRDRNGELVTFQPQTDENILNLLSQELYGNHWIGLRLPAGACSNLSAPLRGYEWTSGSSHTSFIPSLSTWKDRVKVCSPHCVSISKDQKWTERSCSEKIDGFLCRTKHKDACPTDELTDLNIFKSSEDCSDGPCQHVCTKVEGGYKCSCFEGYIPDSEDRTRCKMHCAQQKCPAVCGRDADNACNCPVGFIQTGSVCVDIDECAMAWCEHECKNTFGSFVCSCFEGFVLKDQVKCTAASPALAGFVKSATNNNTLNSSSAPVGGFLWIWICTLELFRVYCP